MDKELGQKIKEVRTSKGMTLKDLSEKTGLSISFLSLVERGLASIAIASLRSVAEVLGVDLAYFFSMPHKHENMIFRSYEQEAILVEHSKNVYCSLASNFEDRKMDPMLTILLPGQQRSDLAPISHHGEEFCYVLEGILTYIIEDKEYELYPGDSVHIPSSIPHNWGNFTNKLVKVILVVFPKIFD
ncbi:cupin domain-containing protein [Desulfotruncus alcoholivorax]|uniref:cupin domain-containing protein n=1 Tax=Desulfotruncus alcoholivorax TaxID=265477 RepID=UPI0004265781|nr:cupin domain-containing protein [Desulfotruncus alcoholivorax]